MKWKAEFMIGIEAIDRQHRQIFEHLLAIENSIEKGDPWNVMSYLITQLGDCLKLHFAVEEALLEIIDYPESRDHCAAHARLCTAIVKLESSIRKSNSATDLVTFFEQWFIRHVLGDDRRYAEYAKNHLPKRHPAKI